MGKGEKGSDKQRPALQRRFRRLGSPDRQHTSRRGKAGGKRSPPLQSARGHRAGVARTAPKPKSREASRRGDHGTTSVPLATTACQGQLGRTLHARTVRLNVSCDNRAGLSLQWSSLGFQVQEINRNPGQPGLSLGDCIIEIEGKSLQFLPNERTASQILLGERFHNGACITVVTPDELAGGQPVLETGGDRSVPAQRQEFKPGEVVVGRVAKAPGERGFGFVRLEQGDAMCEEVQDVTQDATTPAELYFRVERVAGDGGLKLARGDTVKCWVAECGAEDQGKPRAERVEVLRLSLRHRSVAEVLGRLESWQVGLEAADLSERRAAQLEASFGLGIWRAVAEEVLTRAMHPQWGAVDLTPAPPLGAEEWSFSAAGSGDFGDAALRLARRITEEAQMVPESMQKRLRVDELRFTHDVISDHFRNGGALTKLVADMVRGNVLPSGDGRLALAVVDVGGKYRSLNNRRLWALKRFQAHLREHSDSGTAALVEVVAKVHSICPRTVAFIRRSAAAELGLAEPPPGSFLEGLAQLHPVPAARSPPAQLAASAALVPLEALTIWGEGPEVRRRHRVAGLPSPRPLLEAAPAERTALIAKQRLEIEYVELGGRKYALEPALLRSLRQSPTSSSDVHGLKVPLCPITAKFVQADSSKNGGVDVAVRGAAPDAGNWTLDRVVRLLLKDALALSGSHTASRVFELLAASPLLGERSAVAAAAASPEAKQSVASLFWPFARRLAALCPTRLQRVLPVVHSLPSAEPELLQLLEAAAAELARPAGPGGAEAVWSRLPLVPGVGELRARRRGTETLPFVRLTGAYSSPKEYFDTYFRLLREECHYSIREAVLGLQGHSSQERGSQARGRRAPQAREGKKRSTVGDGNIFKSTLLGCCTSQVAQDSALQYVLELLPLVHQRRWRSAAARYLMAGNLLCALSGAGQAKVSQPLWLILVRQDLESNPARVAVKPYGACDPALLLETLGASSTVLVASPVYFRAFEPVLKALQELRPEDMPFVDELVGARSPPSNCSRPRGLRDSLRVDRSLILGARPLSSGPFPDGQYYHIFGVGAEVSAFRLSLQPDQKKLVAFGAQHLFSISATVEGARSRFEVHIHAEGQVSKVRPAVSPDADPQVCTLLQRDAKEELLPNEEIVVSTGSCELRYRLCGGAGTLGSLIVEIDAALSADAEPSASTSAVGTNAVEDAATTAPQRALDVSQLEAVRHAMSHRVAVIQGPPGTGKSFVGHRILELVLATEARVLVVAYKNHALDEFLDMVLQRHPESVIRVGGRSEGSAELKGCNLQTLQAKLLSREGWKDALREDPTLGKLRSQIECARQATRAAQKKLKHALAEYAASASFEEGTLLRCMSWPQLRCFLACDAELTGQGRRAAQLVSKAQGRGEVFLEALPRLVAGAVDPAADLGTAFEDEDSDEESCPGQPLSHRDDPAINELESLARSAVWRWLPSLDVFESLKSGFPVAMEEDDQGAWGHSGELEALDDAGSDRDVEEREEFEETAGPRLLGRGRDGMPMAESSDLITLAQPRERAAVPALCPGVVTGAAADALLCLPQWHELAPADRARVVLAALERRRDTAVTRLRAASQELAERCAAAEELDALVKVELFHHRRVIGMTVTGASIWASLIHRLRPEVVLVEEAAEVLEPQLMALLGPWVRHLILIGDHQQLPPQVGSYRLKQEHHFATSMMERLVMNCLPHAVLQRQSRMLPPLAELLLPIYPKLRSNAAALTKHRQPACVRFECFFWDCTAEEEQLEKSLVNRTEADRAVQLTLFFASQGYRPSQITVLAAYQAQASYIRGELRKRLPEHLARAGMKQVLEPLCVELDTSLVGQRNEIQVSELDSRLKRITRADGGGGCVPPGRYVVTELPPGQKLTSELCRERQRKAAARLEPTALQDHDLAPVCTIDRYQGNENDIVIVSTVRSHEGPIRGFLGTDSGRNRMTVAQSRARCGLYFVGNRQCLSTSPHWETLLRMMEDRGWVGPAFPQVCPRHPSSSQDAQSAEELCRPCGVVCDEAFECGIPGHKCKLPCHGEHISHKASDCTHRTQKSYACSEQPQHWFELRCNLNIKHVPCPFTEQLTCPRNAEHKLTRKCGQGADEVRSSCSWPCGRPLSCGHACGRRCSEPCWRPDECEARTTFTCPRDSGHRIRGLCRETAQEVAARCRGRRTFMCPRDCKHQIDGLCCESSEKAAERCKGPRTFVCPRGHDVVGLCRQEAEDATARCRAPRTFVCPKDGGHQIDGICCESAEDAAARCNALKTFTCPKDGSHQISGVCCETADEAGARCEGPATFTCPKDNSHTIEGVCRERPEDVALRCKGFKQFWCSRDRRHKIDGFCCERGWQVAKRCRALWTFRCTRDSRHKINGLCHESAEEAAARCAEPCAATLACGHPCQRKCNEPCPAACAGCAKRKAAESLTRGPTSGTDDAGRRPPLPAAEIARGALRPREGVVGVNDNRGWPRRRTMAVEDGTGGEGARTNED